MKHTVQWDTNGYFDWTIRYANGDFFDSLSYNSDVTTGGRIAVSANFGTAYLDHIYTESTSTNQPPNINDITTTEYNWNVGVSQDISVDASDPDSTIDTVTYDVIDPSGNVDYSGSLTFNSASGYWEKDDAFTVDERGEWELQIRATDTEGAYNESSTVQTVNPPRVDLESPVNGNNVQSNPVEFNFTPRCYTNSCSKADLYVNVSGGWQVVNSTSNVVNNSINTLEYNFSEQGDYKWNVEITDSKDRYNSSDTSGTFNLQLLPEPELDLLSPIDTFEEAPVEFSFLPRCYSNGGCQDADLLINASWVRTDRQTVTGGV
jgi:hypothetical protein